MINTDDDAVKIIKDRLLIVDKNSIEYKILSFVILLMNSYSFVDNQTYPRPSHPNCNKRKEPYFTLIAIIISLRTTLENEQKAVNNFLSKYKSIDDVINSSIDEISSTITCAGMSLKKAKVIMNLSLIIKKQYNGDISKINNGNIEDIRNKLMQLPGLGDKSADCMLELAFDLPSIVIDTNMFRVVSRLFIDKSNMNFNNKDDILYVKKFLEDNLYSDYRIYQIVHTIFLLHGKNICRSNPLCSKCVFYNECKYYLKNNKQLTLF